jgi:hypothetical protein
MINGKTYLDETYQTYCKLIENTNLVKKNMKNMISLPHTLPHTLPNKQVQVPNTKMIETVTKFNNEANDIENNLTKEMIPDFIALESKIEEHLENNDEEKEGLNEELKEEEQVILSDTIVKPKRKYTKKSDKANI